jgi:hypothetical protein
MFRWLLDRPGTFFGFLSGIFISVATTALSNFALAEQAPGNISKLIRSALISFLAASSWFLLGELITALKKRVAENQEGLTGTKEQTYTRALQVVEKTEGWKLYALLLVAAAASVLWPFL